jgi:hypothetical protein
MRNVVRFVAFLGLAGLLVGPALRADDKKAADEKAAMEAMMRAATPGEPHKLLATMAGSWDISMKAWMDPSKPPEESKATSEAKMILGGRYLEEKITGSFGGMEFLGQALQAYDNVQKKHIFAFIDNFGTGISTADGKYDAEKKTISYNGEEIDPLSGNKTKTKMLYHLIDKDKYEVDMFRVVDGKDVKSMHLDCVRKAAK